MEAKMVHQETCHFFGLIRVHVNRKVRMLKRYLEPKQSPDFGRRGVQKTSFFFGFQKLLDIFLTLPRDFYFDMVLPVGCLPEPVYIMFNLCVGNSMMYKAPVASLNAHNQA